MIRKLSEKEAAGMTVNERLFVSGLFDEFDKAVNERDENAMRAILEQVYLTSENIKAIIRSELGN